MMHKLRNSYLMVKNIFNILVIIYIFGRNALM